MNKILQKSLLFLFLSSLFLSAVQLVPISRFDNYLEIGSGSNSNFFSYYLFSILSTFTYYCGLWVFSLLVVSVIFKFDFFKNQRGLKANLSLVMFPLTILFLGKFFFTSLVGEGLVSILDLALNHSMQVGLLSVFLCSYAAIITTYFLSKNEQTIFDTLKSFYHISSEKLFGLFKFSRDRAGDVKTELLKLPFLAKQSEQEKKNIFKNEESPLVTPVSRFEQNINRAHADKVIADDDSMKIDDGVSEVIGDVIYDSPIEAIDIVEDGMNDVLTLGARKIRAQEQAYAVSENDYMELTSSLQYSTRINHAHPPDDAYFSKIKQRIEEKLQEFKIGGEVINVLKGPVVDTFELELGSGVRVSKVTSSSEDLSLALFGIPVRVVYPMKGRTTVGIEVPRDPREIIFLPEVISTKEFNHNNLKLPLAFGKDAFGEPFIVDLAAMPHMLVAGATGAGKSVFINTILVSLLVKKSPQNMKLILVDPKQLELALYSKLPHLIMPVVIDSKQASTALLWAVQEMERRYSILKELGVRNIEGFNEKIKTASQDTLNLIQKYYDNDEYELPYIVIIVDEFADLILTKSGKDIETNIARLAGKARASGIHLIIATQRPSVDVITGLIKANFPTRVSFRVSSSTDSRTILNTIGAEKLLGKGDMLYKHGVEMLRLHSAYIDEREIENFLEKINVKEPQFDQTVLDFLENGGEDSDEMGSFGGDRDDFGDDKDPLYEDAIKVVMEYRVASASMLQRRLKVGYNRAANLIDQLELKGVIGPAQGSKPRKVLMQNEL